LDIVVENIKRRLNVYGLADVNVKTLKDLEGNSFVLVEISGAQDEELKELLAKQGKFEAKIGNETVFKGGNDITYVCRSADCSGITSQGCVETTNGYVCEFRFSISLTPEAAQRQAEATKDLEIIYDNTGKDNDGWLSQNLSLFLDDELVDELRISSGLKGKAETEISISGSGVGTTYEDAALNTLENMKRLQTILITGSLPVKLEIINTETLSPLLGEDFLKNVLFIGVLALVSVITIITLRYRKLIIALPIALTLVSEVIIILGVASMISWNLDLVAIAGIIIAVGTGVDDLIIITDETLNETTEVYSNWKEKLKKAFFIIMAAYFTTFAAMLPLIWNPITGGAVAAGLLKGFAFTTIIGISAGVLISRPAFGRMIEILVEE
jgi:preprotein translocase subunit SecD